MKIVIMMAAMAAGLIMNDGKTKPPLSQERPVLEERTQVVKMNVGRLRSIIEHAAANFVANQNVWEFQFSGVQMVCVSDTNADRMRIIAPIIQVSSLTPEQKDKMLEANFHSALDVRYATSNGVVWAAFIHPLSPLDDAEVSSALAQVAQSVQTFGGSYSSTGIVFGSPNQVQ